LTELGIKTLGGDVDVNKVVQFFKSNPTFYLATAEGDQPRVRPFGAVMEWEGRVYFCTNNQKKVFQQFTANPKVEICTASAAGEWLRVTGRAVVDPRREARAAMLEAYPDLGKMYQPDDGVYEVFYLTDAVATFESFSGAPETITL
jgi:uncharacterized pyridoxamine 5'-phosphate oxidase family protein